jgi:hypothetical protein
MFRCESAMLRTHWILLVIDQYTRRIIGFAVHAGPVDGIALCRIEVVRANHIFSLPSSQRELIGLMVDWLNSAFKRSQAKSS